MAKLNVPPKRVYEGKTAEGGPARKMNPLQRLKRLVMSCLLWEDEFYVDGQTVASQIVEAVHNVKPEEAMNVAIEARTKMNLRHVPLMVVTAMDSKESHRSLVSRTLQTVIQRADELAEFVTILWHTNGKTKKLSMQVKKGLAKAFTKFNEYALAKYNRDGAIKLRDVLFLSHAKPKDVDQAKLFKKLIGGFCEKCWKPLDLSPKAKKAGVKECKCAEKVAAKLDIPDTWETELSAGKDKNKTFTRLLKEEKLGALALLRNLRNMSQSGVDRNLVREAIKGMDGRRVFPFRYIAAARFAPEMEDVLEEAMFKTTKEMPKLKGRTVVLVDVSGSMDAQMSGKSDMTRMDAACGVAMVCRELCDEAVVYSFSNSAVKVAPRRGFALREAIINSQGHGGTNLGASLKQISTEVGEWDRIIVITDEQSADAVHGPAHGIGYMVNVASNQRGVGYGKWVHMDGFSEAIITYIAAYESQED